MYLIISATNRTQSVSYAIALYYQTLLRQKGSEARVLSLETLPADFIFSALYENAGKNENFNSLASEVREAEKLIFIIPEYNGSFPGVLKAFVDGLGWPNALTGKKIALVSLGDGSLGGAHALSHFTDILHFLNAHVLGMLVRIPHVGRLFTENRISDPKLDTIIQLQVKGIIGF